jgi:hypothetical protein
MRIALSARRLPKSPERWAVSYDLGMMLRPGALRLRTHQSSATGIQDLWEPAHREDPDIAT